MYDKTIKTWKTQASDTLFQNIDHAMYDISKSAAEKGV